MLVLTENENSAENEFILQELYPFWYMASVLLHEVVVGYLDTKRVRSTQPI